MPIEANYETYYGIKLTHYTHTWGGTTYGGSNTNGILVRDFPDTNLVSVASTNISDMSFLYPRLITAKVYVDGVAEGHFTLYNKHASTATIVTAYTVSIKMTDDVPVNETTLGSYSNTISTDNSVAANDYFTLPFYIPISKQLLEEDEKILLNITFTGGTDLCFSHENDSSLSDVKIKIPFAAEG